MSEYELVDVMYTIFASMNESATLYFTLVSAYLGLSFFIGERLTKVQLIIVNTLYIIWVIGVINSGYGGLSNAVTVMGLLNEMGSPFQGQGQRITQGAVYGFMLVQFGGMLASLYFMWSVRKAKSE